MQAIRNAFPLILVALSVCPAHAELPSGLTHIELSINRRVLRPMCEHEGTAKLTLRRVEADGSSRIVPCSAAEITARTKCASGKVEVVAIEGDTVVAREGGIATVEAVVRENGQRLQATVDVVVAPFYRDYHQSLVLKLFLGMEGEPVNKPGCKDKYAVLCTFSEALEVIRKTDNLTRGIPKIIYLVGWQKGGHDHGYPAWAEAGVNPRLKRPQDATALDSLRWLIREARKFNTTVSLHINMVDAYRQSPLWDEYAAKDCFAKDSRGKVLAAGIQVKGEEMYNVVYPKEWEAGLAQRRIDRLIQMIPELKDGHTIHIDVFIANRDNGRPISPWHAKPEQGGLTPEKYVESQRKIFHYWRDRGFDVTGEGIFWAHPPGEGFTGLQAMSWWYPGDPGYQMQIPEYLMARGRTDRGGDGDFHFGSSMHGEEIWRQDKEKMPGFLGMFCRTTLPWYYLSRLERMKFESGALYYGDGVVARNENGKSIIRKGDFILRENDNLFVPALWHEKEIIAYSRNGYSNKSWQMPVDWESVQSVDIYRIALEGCSLLRGGIPVNDGKLILSLGKDEAVSIVPAGTNVIIPAKPHGRNEELPQRWSEQQAWQWYNKQPWIVGFNFVTSTAVNDIEMWQADTFDPKNIDRELQIAGGLGYNTARVFINYHLWEDDAPGLKARMKQYLTIAEKHSIRTVWCPMDYCNFTKPRRPPKLGKQGEPNGQHGGNWVESPREEMARDPKQFPLLKRYLIDIVGAFAHDRRVLMWDLYNEPTQPVWELTLACFDWAREARPEQPITVGHQQHVPWRLARQLFDRSDIVTFHLYGRAEETARRIEEIRRLTKYPLVCTEWLNTLPGSKTDIPTSLPIYKREKVGAICWGMMQDRLQTPVHDILRPDGTPLYPQDVETLRELTGAKDKR